MLIHFSNHVSMGSTWSRRIELAFFGGFDGLFFEFRVSGTSFERVVSENRVVKSYATIVEIRH
jgi:hypothetical protein